MIMKHITTNHTKLPPFVPVPHFLWDEPFKALSVESKLLYGFILSRAELSKQNNMADKTGRIYIYFSLSSVMELLSCGEQKASRLMKELRSHGLIERKRQGCGKPYQVFPKMVDFTADNQCR